MVKDSEDSKSVYPPYSLSIKGASEHFGLAAKTLYNWINEGKLHRGIHYLKAGRKPLIIREAFIEFLETEDGLRWIAKEKAKSRNPIETMSRETRSRGDSE